MWSLQPGSCKYIHHKLTCSTPHCSKNKALIQTTGVHLFVVCIISMIKSPDHLSCRWGVLGAITAAEVSRRVALRASCHFIPGPQSPKVIQSCPFASRGLWVDRVLPAPILSSHPMTFVSGMTQKTQNYTQETFLCRTNSSPEVKLPKNILCVVVDERRERRTYVSTVVNPCIATQLQKKYTFVQKCSALSINILCPSHKNENIK